MRAGKRPSFATTRGELADVCASELIAGEHVRVIGRPARTPNRLVDRD